jgi:hypothetical protein
MQPSRVALELCRGRLQAMLLDPYADPLWDTEPCLQRAAKQAAAKNRSLAEIFEATLKSRDHNVLMTALTGMYARLEGMGTCCFFLFVKGYRCVLVVHIKIHVCVSCQWGWTRTRVLGFQGWRLFACRSCFLLLDMGTRPPALLA